MDNAKLYDIVDYILNSADSSELDVIRAAVRRRETDASKGGPMGVDLGKQAREMAEQVTDQLGVSTSKIRETVRGFVEDMLRKQAPELSKEQREELMDAWISGRGRQSAAPDTPPTQSGSAGAERSGKRLPPEALLTMIKQFVSFSTGAMSVTEEVSLRESMPDWHNRYWENFPPIVKKLLKLFLKGVINSDDFWAGIRDELGLAE